MYVKQKPAMQQFIQDFFHRILRIILSIGYMYDYAGWQGREEKEGGEVNSLYAVSLYLNNQWMRFL